MDQTTTTSASKTFPVKANFLRQTVRFDLPEQASFQTLVEELNKRFAGVKQIHYIDDEGDVISLSSDNELRYAITLSPGLLRLALVGESSLSNKDAAIRRWVQRVDPEDNGKWEPLLYTLNDMGFLCYRRNLKILKKHQGDLQKTIAILNSRGKGRCEERAERRCGKRKLHRDGDVVMDDADRVDTADLVDTADFTDDRDSKYAYKRRRFSDKENKRCAKEKRLKDKQEKDQHKQLKKKEKEEKKLKRSEQQQAFRPPLPDIAGQTVEASKHFRAVAENAFLHDLSVRIQSGVPSEQFTHVFVDGNNMLYLTDKLRRFTLGRKVDTTQKVLISVARRFAELVKIQAEIIFDSASASSLRTGNSSVPESSAVPNEGTPSSGILLDNGSTFLVSSARPSFNTTDDKLVAWCRERLSNAPATSSSSTAPSAENSFRVLVVTSDRALAGELFSLGVSVVKPGVWLACLANMAAGSSDNVDWKAWLDAWIDQVMSKDETE